MITTHFIKNKSREDIDWFSLENLQLTVILVVTIKEKDLQRSSSIRKINSCIEFSLVFSIFIFLDSLVLRSHTQPLRKTLRWQSTVFCSRCKCANEKAITQIIHTFCSGASITADYSIILEGSKGETPPSHLKNPERKCILGNDADLVSSPINLGSVTEVQV